MGTGYASGYAYGVYDLCALWGLGSGLVSRLSLTRASLAGRVSFYIDVLDRIVRDERLRLATYEVGFRQAFFVGAPRAPVRAPSLCPLLYLG